MSESHLLSEAASVGDGDGADSTALIDALQPDEPRPTFTAPTTPTITHQAPTDSSTFTFPTLSLDGSLPDLADTSAKHYPPAPPAALSSLGARSNMADFENLSETSLDAQYDMIDDLSEISTDDHDTASLVSTEHEEAGQLTPEESIVDLHEVQNRDDTVVGGQEVAAENELLDSYMSEELETPRQSLLHEPERSGIHTTLPSSLTQLTAQGTRRVLFISTRPVEKVEISDICLQIASCLVPRDRAATESLSRLVNLPLTANRTSPASALQLRVADVELLVEPCTSMALQPDLHTIDFVIFYQNTLTSNSNQFVAAKKAVRKAGIPSILLASPSFEFWMLKDADSYDSGLVLTNKELFPEDDRKLRANLHTLLVKRQPISKVKPYCFWDMCPLDGLYRDNGKFTWQEFALRLLPLIAIVLALIIKQSNVLDLIDGPPPNSNAAVDVRRDALSTVLAKMNNSPDATKVFNIDHLLPYSPEQVSSEHRTLNEVRFQGIPPNRILISLPAMSEDWIWMQPVQQFPAMASTSVHRSEKNIDFNQTKLLDGVYDIVIPTDEAYGIITVNMTTKTPKMHVYISHDFGNRLLRRKTYEKAGMELSKAINKDVTVARRNVKSFGEKVGLELTAGATATKNVTSELAVYIARDLQVLANTAISVFGRAVAGGNETAAAVRKELVVLQRELAVFRKDLGRLGRDVQKSVLATAQEAKALIPSLKTLQYPLEVSKERAGRFRDLLRARREERKDRKKKLTASTPLPPATSPTGELATRLRNALKSMDKDRATKKLPPLHQAKKDRDAVVPKWAREKCETWPPYKRKMNWGRDEEKIKAIEKEAKKELQKEAKTMAKSAKKEAKKEAKKKAKEAKEKAKRRAKAAKEAEELDKKWVHVHKEPEVGDGPIRILRG